MLNIQTNIQRLTQVAGKNPIYAATIDKIMAAKSEAEVNSIISEYSKSNSKQTNKQTDILIE